MASSLMEASEPPLIRVVAAVIKQDDRYLLAKRPAHKAQPGLWEFPGGKVEPGETPAQALSREMLEELGVKGAVVSDSLGSAVHSYGDKRVRIEAYRVHCDASSLRALEHDELAWKTTDEMRAMPLAPADIFLIDLLSAG